MSSQPELPVLMLELADLFERRGDVAERDRWPPYLRGLAKELHAGQPVDLAEFHRQLVRGEAVDG